MQPIVRQSSHQEHEEHNRLLSLDRRTRRRPRRLPAHEYRTQNDCYAPHGVKGHLTLLECYRPPCWRGVSMRGTGRRIHLHFQQEESGESHSEGNFRSDCHKEQSPVAFYLMRLPCGVEMTSLPPQPRPLRPPTFHLCFRDIDGH